MQGKLKTVHVKYVCAHRKHENGTVCKLMSCPDPERVSSFLKTITGSDACVGEGDLICSMCYKYFSQLLQSGVCMLSSDDIIYKLRTKRSQLNDTLENFVCTTPNCHVMLAMYKTAFHVCEGLLHNQAFLVQFGSVLSLKTSYHRLGMLCGGTGYVAAG